jgi:hypothetical protein
MVTVLRWFRLGSVAGALLMGLGCLTSTDDVAGIFDPPIKLVVDEPFAGARIEGFAFPVVAEVRKTHKDAIVSVSIVGLTGSFEAFTWPDEREGDVDLGDVGYGPRELTFAALEQDDETDNLATVQFSVEFVAPGSADVDYPAP